MDNLYDVNCNENFCEERWLEIVKQEDPALLYAPHQRADGRFFNPWLPMDFNVKMLKHTLRYLRTSPKIIPQNIDYETVTETYFRLRSQVNSLAFLGHASFVLSLDGSTILTDPFFSWFAAFVKKNINVKVDYKSISSPVVLISHNHYDHLDKKSVKKLIKRGAIFVVPLNLKKYFLKLGASTVYELDWWESVVINDVKYTFLPAQHWSVRIGQPVNTTLWGSFMVEGSKRIYFSGDTGYFAGYKEFGRRFGKIDYALLAAGAYHPRWQRFYQHQSVDDFFLAADDLNASVSIPMHYGTVKLGKESIDYPAYEIETKMSHLDRERIKIVKIGESVLI